MIISSGYTDKGLVRDLNEDSWFVFEPSPTAKAYCAIVADGMGGHNAGEIASSEAVKKIAEFISERYSDDLSYNEIKVLAISAVELANSKVYSKSTKDNTTVGMGTTLTMCFVTGNKAIAVHIGDSRLYLIRKKTIHRITKDHSLVAELVAQGKITEEEAEVHPQKNVITRALGTEPQVDVDVCEFSIRNSDIILMCSDGLYNMLTDTQIKNIVFESENIISSPKDLVCAANENGGTDNITAVVLKYTANENKVEGEKSYE